jgi:hypothetical protein
MARLLGSKNKVKKNVVYKKYLLLVDKDIEQWFIGQEKKARYLNDLIRKDYEEHLKNQEEKA